MANSSKIEMQEIGGGRGSDASPLATTVSTTTSALSSKLSSATTAATDFAKSMYSRVQTADPLQVGLCVLLAVVLSFAIWYIIYKVNQKKDEIESTYVITNNDLKPFGASRAFANLGFDVSTLPLRNFYIKTAINCCCLGEWKDNYVDIVALQSAITDGYRCLDF